MNNAFRFDAFQSFEEVDLAIWRKIMDTNLFGSLQMTRAALPAMRARGGGSVVMVASMVTRQPQPAQGGYAISKGALLTATRVLAYELGPSKVRVNAVVPGWMAGPSVDIYVEMTSTGRGVPAQVVVDELNARVPLGRIPSDGDVAGSIVYLASDLSSRHDRAGARHQRRRDLRLTRASVGRGSARAQVPSPPLAVHERGSQGWSASTVGVGAWNAPEFPVLPLLPAVVVVRARRRSRRSGQRWWWSRAAR